MKTTSTETVKDTFTMIDDNLLAASIQRITAQQKLLISWILRWQKNDKECFASNQKIAETLGMSKEGIKSLLKSCTYSFPTFFNCIPDERDNGVPFHTISIDLEELMKFLIDGKPVNKIKRRNKPSTQNKAPELTIISQPILEVKVDEILTEIKDNKQIKLVTVDIPVPVIENKIDSIDLKNFNVDRLIEFDSKFSYEKSKVPRNKYFNTLLNLNNGLITFQQMIAECNEILINEQNKNKELV